MIPESYLDFNNFPRIFIKLCRFSPVGQGASCGHEDKWFHGLAEAKSGDSVGVKVSERVRSEDLVYKITD